ncbi:uncharacterized protein A1O9_08739 [Exophiala aquamarina CBS 119918]|uniref:Uncharacterized protein n=1 Tax=Exophiala aquamarina CBS 119918 TaxID=1182545 RepID=A0A072P5E8_9EURO|nr:uncharacterized protein A1O9_08739 [Exophiala aquamarina CBS 119918]KEF55086.1 hypothetical protein A1O9_08739 [Exophiala aquamarina CBS 119918]
MPFYAITGASRGTGDLVSSRKNLHVLNADITNPEQLRCARSTISDATGGSLDVLFQNAGWNTDATAALSASAVSDGDNLPMIRAALVDAIDHNVIVRLSVINILLPLIHRGAGKRIVVLSTALADIDVTLKTGMSHHIPHSSSKAAMNVVLAKLAIDLQK